MVQFQSIALPGVLVTCVMPPYGLLTECVFFHVSVCVHAAVANS